MFENIKSLYIKKKIFEYLNDERELKIIKYNKNLQNQININLDNYKIFSGRYIIYETNVKGKEYDYNDTLIFEGEYLNGERNGKGKEFYDNELIYEGEYYNGKRHGKGKEYINNYDDFDNELIFEGEYLNGKKWNGKGYDKKGNIIFELKKGNGKRKKYNEFEGEYINGEINGKGKEYYYEDKLKFEGEYLNRKRWNGIYYNINNIKEYEIKNGNCTMKEYNYEGILEFEGEYLNGERNGKGKEYNIINK